MKSTNKTTFWQLLVERGLLVVTVVISLISSGAIWAADEWIYVGPGLENIRALATDPLRGTLYAGTWFGSAGVVRSEDGGMSWHVPNRALAPTFVTGFAIDLHNSGTIYAATYYGVFKSTDSGVNWLPLNPDLVGCWAVVVDPQNSGTIYAATGYGDIDVSHRGIFKSSDGGTTWVPMPLVESIYTLAIDSLNPNVVFAGGWGGVYKSTNGANSWERINIPGVGYLLTLATDPRVPNTLYAGAYPRGVFKSEDGGRTWVRTALETGAVVQALLIDLQNSNRVYAATAGAGIFRSDDGGEHWSALNAGLGNLNVAALAADPAKPGRVYAGTNGGGVYTFTPADHNRQRCRP